MGTPGGRQGILRRSEWVVLAFLIYAAALAASVPVPPAGRRAVILSNLAIAGLYALLIRFDARHRIAALGIVRDWLPLGIILFAYREMDRFAQPRRGHPLETAWIVWDRAVLRGGGKAAIEALGPVIPSVLEIAYTMVYLLAPLAIAVLYLDGRRDRVDQFLTLFAAGVLLSYAQFPFWPSDPPRVLFAGQDLPAYDTVFRRFNAWMLGNYGIHTSVFPSGHVAGAFSAAFGLRRALPERRGPSRFLFVAASFIAVATVYGRYHYFADAAAGLAMAALALAKSYAPRALGETTVPIFSRPVEWLRLANRPAAHP